MSTFEDYHKASKSYDEERNQVGADIMAGLLHIYGGKPIQDLHLLDAGCGTGNFAKALIEFGVGKVTLLDASVDMLNVAKDKLKDAIDKHIIDKVVEAKMPPLPFDDGSFDVILFSLVLHHLDTDSNGEVFPAMEETLREAKRVLRHNGVMIIAETLPSLVREANWFTQLHPALCERYSKRFPSMKENLAMLDRSGFQCVTKLNTLGGNQLMRDYYDAEGPLKKEWRNTVSFFAIAKEEEIRDIENSVRKMIEKGTIQQFIKEHDRALELGFTTILACIPV